MSYEKTDTCIFCGREDLYYYEKEHVRYCNCANCGIFSISSEANDDLPDALDKYYKNRKYLISGLLRELTEKELSFGVITNDNFDNIISDIRVPKTIKEKINKFILYIYRKTGYLGEEIELFCSQLAVGYLCNIKELKIILDTLKKSGYLQYRPVSGKEDRKLNNILTFHVQLSLDGIEKAEYLLKEDIQSKQCFVAMWFRPDLLEMFNTIIKDEIKDKTGYDALIISNKEHNDNITDEIIAEIRKSKFVISDFTGQRGGVYFEAGFAMGLGKPVIWTCHKDDLKKLHFDIRQYNFIVWETHEDLCYKLINRINATVPLVK